MLNYEKLSRKASIFKTFTGLEVSEFDALYAKLEAVNPEYEEKRLARSDRKHKTGAGHPFKLNLKNRFLLLLLYYRLYASSTLIGFLFDLGQTNVLKDIRALEPATQAILPLPKKIHDATRRLQSVHRRHRTGNSKAKSKAKTQNPLQRQKEAPHRKNPADREQQRLNRPQNKPRQRQQTRLRPVQAAPSPSAKTGKG
jgi:hypothetical protein